MAQQILLNSQSKRTLSQAESFALVQIFLNASLACIAHTRELIPWTSPCFHTRYIDQINLEDQFNGQSLYSSFQALASEVASEGQEIKVLVRGGHRRADQILDMLVGTNGHTSSMLLTAVQEQGVFDALERGYLDSLQVFVTRTSQGQLTILETYHFAFLYDQGRVSSVQVNPTNTTFILESVHKSFKAAIRALLRSLRDLPRLPARRKLGMSLAYNQTCPMVYQPLGFVDKDDFQKGDTRTMCDSLLAGAEGVVGMLETGHYQVRVGVRLPNSEAQDSSIDLQDTEMSKQLQAMQKTSSSHSNNLLSTLRESVPRTKRPADAPTLNSKRAKATTPGKPSSKDSVSCVGHGNTPRPSQSLRESSFAEIESPLLEKSSSSFTAATKDLPKGKGVCLASTKLTELLVHCYAIQSGKAGGGGGVFDQDLLAKGQIKRLARSSNVNCECGTQHRDHGMLYCEVCDGWQHSNCYGYGEHPASAIMSDSHFCYTCLLFSEERKTRDSPLSIILLRMAVDHLTAQVKAGSRIDENFLQTRLKPCRWTKQVLNHVMERLVKERLLVPRNSRLFEVRSLKESELHQIKDKCLSPLASVGYLYESCPCGEDALERNEGIMKLLETYAKGQDYKTAEGCEELISYDEFGDPVLRWGYGPGSTISPPDASNMKAGAATPVRQRKISISRMLINVDCSPSAASGMSLEDPSSRFRDDLAYNSDFSTADSTMTAE